MHPREEQPAARLASVHAREREFHASTAARLILAAEYGKWAYNHLAIVQVGYLNCDIHRYKVRYMKGALYGRPF